MTTTPSEPVDNPQPDPQPGDGGGDSGDDTKDASSTGGQEATAPEYIDDSQLPEDLQPGPDNPLAGNADEAGTGGKTGAEPPD